MSDTPTRPLNGWLVVDKPINLTSARVVARLKRLCPGSKVGHCGTLDPLATGVLPVAFGEATKTVSYAMAGLKRYRFQVRWGEARDTDDAEGRVIETNARRPDAAAIEAALAAFQGLIQQVPPDYSAIKVRGRRAYELARQSRPVTLAPREVRVDRFALMAAESDTADFEVTCGKGTYVRALARDLARALETVGHVAALRRTAVGPFDEKDAISLDNQGVLVHSAALAERLLPVEAALADIPALALTIAEAERLHHGQAIATASSGDGIVCARTGKRLVALAEVNRGLVRPVRVFNL